MLFRELIGISLTHNTHHRLDFSKLLNAKPYKRVSENSPFPKKIQASLTFISGKETCILFLLLQIAIFDFSCNEPLLRQQ